MGTSLVTVHYGGLNVLRRTAVRRALKSWDEQEVKPDDSMFLELVCPGESPCFSDIDMPPWIKYNRIIGQKRNAHIMQKEALWNIGLHRVGGDKILFIDDDISPINTTSYFKDVFNACAEGVVVHVGEVLVNERFEPSGADRIYKSLFTPAGLHDGIASVYPGGGYCITRKDLERRDGFNPFGITGSGDVIFIKESFKVSYLCHDPIRYQEGTYRKGMPELNGTVVHGTTVRHNFHGSWANRGYLYSRMVLGVFGRPYTYTHLDSGGLVAWNDPDTVIADIIADKSRMTSKEALYRWVCGRIGDKLNKLDADRSKQELRYDGKDFNKQI